LNNGLPDLSLVSDILISFVSLALVNHLVLVHALGFEAWAASPYGMRHSMIFGLATAVLLFAVSVGAWLILKLAAWSANTDAVTWLALPVTAVLAAILLGPLQAFIDRCYPQDALAVKATLPWAAVNSAVIGSALTAWQRLDTLASVLGFAAASAFVFWLFLLVFAAIRERTSNTDVPYAFQGTPVLLLSAAIMSLAIMAFDGIAPTWVTP
jgi:electron transport complex protein RnfA